MKFLADCKLMGDALAQIRKTCGNVEYVSLKLTKKAAKFSATNKTNTHVLKIKGIEIIEPGEVALPVSQLEGVIRNRKTLQFSMDNHAVFYESVEGNKYKGEIAPLPYEEHTISVEGETDIAMTAEQVSALDDTLAVARINSAYETQQLPINLRLNADGIVASCGDNYHMAYIHNRSVSFDNDHILSVLAEAFSIVSAAAKGQPYTLNLSKNSLVATGKTFQLQMPFLDTEGAENSLEICADLNSKVTKDKKATSCVVSKAEFAAICDNAGAFYSANVPFHITVGAKGLVLSISTPKGSARESIKAQEVVNPRKEAFKLEMSILTEFLAHVSVDALPIRVSEDGSLMMMRVDHADIERTYTCGTL